MFSKAFIVAAIASLVAAAPTHTDAAPAKRSADSYNNQATYYDGETGSAGSCGGMLNNSERFIAVSADRGSGKCGKWMGIYSYETGQTAYGYIADTCPTCEWNHLDLSPALFNDLGVDASQGVANSLWVWELDF